MAIIKDRSTYKTRKKKKEKLKSGLKFMLSHTRDFCDKTSLHGFKYVTEEGAHWIQSLFWAIFVILGFIFCSILMILIWSRFSSTPTITAVETVNYPVWRVPFPAVTICDVNKVHKGNINRIKGILMKNDISEERAMNFFMSLGLLVNIINVNDTFSDVFAILARNNIPVDMLMLELTQKCSELLSRCTWLGNVIDCSKLFRMIKTDEGYCCSFNYHHTNESYEGEEFVENEFKSEEIHTAGAGIQTGVSAVVHIDDANYLSGSRTTAGAIVLVHECTNYPEIRTLGTLINKGDSVYLPVEAFVIDTTSDVKTLDYTVRNCTFKNEKTLSIGEYGYENCIIECRMDTLLSLCGCLPYYYNINQYKYKTVRFCDLNDMRCIAKNRHDLFTLASEESDGESHSGLKCKCYPFCDIYWYSYPVDTTDMNDGQVSQSNTTGLHVYFSEFSCMKYKQGILITWDGLFANFGGIFGLCLGGSILSIVELLYHFTIRLYVSIRHRGENNNMKDELNNKKAINTITVSNGLILGNNNQAFTRGYHNRIPARIYM